MAQAVALPLATGLSDGLISPSSRSSRPVAGTPKAVPDWYPGAARQRANTGCGSVEPLRRSLQGEGGLLLAAPLLSRRAFIGYPPDPS